MSSSTTAIFCVVDAVEHLLRQYESAIAQGGRKLANEQLRPRRELMTKILELW
jgi:hypothetical protein